MTRPTRPHDIHAVLGTRCGVTGEPAPCSLTVRAESPHYFNPAPPDSHAPSLARTCLECGSFFDDARHTR